jgi:hypothetical protein
VPNNDVGKKSAQTRKDTNVELKKSIPPFENIKA